MFETFAIDWDLAPSAYFQFLHFERKRVGEAHGLFLNGGVHVPEILPVTAFNPLWQVNCLAVLPAVLVDPTKGVRHA